MLSQNARLKNGFDEKVSTSMIASGSARAPWT